MALLLEASLIGAPVQDRDSIEDWVRATLAAMTLDQKIGQVLMVGADAGVESDPAAVDTLSRAVTEFHVAGIVTRGAVTPAIDSLRAREPVPLLIVAMPAEISGLELGLSGVRATRSLRHVAAADPVARRQAVVQMLVAGYDLLFDVPDAAEAFWAIGAAVERGDITLERLEDSVARVLRAKARSGLIHVL